MLADLVIESILATTRLNPADAAVFAGRHNLPLWLVADQVEPEARRAAWSAADDELLREQLGLTPVSDLAAVLNRRLYEVDRRAIRLRLPWHKIIAGREAYTVPLAAWLLGVSGQTVAGWGQSGYLTVVEQPDGERLIRRGDLYRLLAVPEAADILNPARIVDPHLRRVWQDRRDRPTRRPATMPELRFTAIEDAQLIQGAALGLGNDLLAGLLTRPERELAARLSLIGPIEADCRPDWTRSGLDTLVEAIVRYDAGRGETRDWLWVGRLFLAWLDGNQVAYPPAARQLLDGPHAGRVVAALHRRLQAAGLDPLRVEPPVVGDLPAIETEEPRPGWGSYHWTAAEIALVRDHCGLYPLSKVAAACTELLQRLTGDHAARRTVTDVQNLINRSGLDGRRRWDVGLTIADAVRLSGINRGHFDLATESGELAVLGDGKYRYIRWNDWFSWRKKHQAYLDSIEMAATAIPEQAISKQEAMGLIGISETQIARYLQGGILRAWKLPVGKDAQRGEWRVSLTDAERVKAERENGRLNLDTPGFQAQRDKSIAACRKLRANGYRAGYRAESAWLPTHLTPHGVGQLAGVCRETVIRDIRAGLLPVQVNRVGQRVRYAITPADAAAYAARKQTTKG